MDPPLVVLPPPLAASLARTREIQLELAHLQQYAELKREYDHHAPEGAAARIEGHPGWQTIYGRMQQLQQQQQSEQALQLGIHLEQQERDIQARRARCRRWCACGFVAVLGGGLIAAVLVYRLVYY
jgi:hypothetical protein